MKRVVFDIETIGEFSGSMDLSQQELTVVAIYDSETDAYQSFLKEELSKLWPILEHADILIGYNSDHFDIPILNRYYMGDLTKIKSIDLLKEIRNVLGRRLRLDNIAEATLGKRKTGNGLEAMDWWLQGDIERVRTYCIEDVRITNEIYEYALKNQSLKYKDFSLGVRDIKLDTSSWEQCTERNHVLTHTLPF